MRLWDDRTNRVRNNAAFICGLLGTVDAAFLYWTPIYLWLGWIPWVAAWPLWLFSEAMSWKWSVMRFATWVLAGFSMCAYMIHLAQKLGLV